MLIDTTQDASSAFVLASHVQLAHCVAVALAISEVPFRAHSASSRSSS